MSQGISALALINADVNINSIKLKNLSLTKKTSWIFGSWDTGAITTLLLANEV